MNDLASGGSPADMGWNQNPFQPQQPEPYQQPQQPYQPQPSYQPIPPYQSGPQAPASNGSLPFILPDPPKDPEPKHPGGFVPYNASSSDIPNFEASSGSSSLSPEQIAKAQKYCKYISSALTYDDVPTAIDNLQKCLRLLQTGQDS